MKARPRQQVFCLEAASLVTSDRAYVTLRITANQYQATKCSSVLVTAILAEHHAISGNPMLVVRKMASHCSQLPKPVPCFKIAHSAV